MSLRFILLIFIVALNAFFSAAEVALVVARRSRLEDLARQGNVAARAALGILANPERLLSVTQVGVTVASLALGWAGEETMYNLILRAFNPIITEQESHLLHIASYTIAFLVTSFIHVVIGEVVPKNLALDLIRREKLFHDKQPEIIAFVDQWSTAAGDEDHAARTAAAPAPVRFPAKACSARRSSGWQGAPAAAAARARRRRRSGSRSAHLAAMDLGPARRRNWNLEEEI